MRARRAERVRDQKMRDMPKVVAKNVAIGLAVVVAVGGVGALVWWSTEGQEDHVHWHAAWELYVRDEEEGAYRHIDYRNPTYDLSSGSEHATPPSYHLHVAGASGTDDVVHLESRPPPFILDRFFGALGMDMDRTSVKMDSLHGGTRYSENATHEWRLFVQPFDGDWEESGRFGSYRMDDGDRLLITFGDPADMDGRGGELERQLASVSRDLPAPHDRDERGLDTVGGEESPPADGDNASEGARDARRE